MSQRKRRKRVAYPPTVLVFSRRDQLRMVEAVERFISLVGDLVILIGDAKRRRQAGKRDRHPNMSTSSTE